MEPLRADPLAADGNDVVELHRRKNYINQFRVRVYWQQQQSSLRPMSVSINNSGISQPERLNLMVGIGVWMCYREQKKKKRLHFSPRTEVLRWEKI